ASAYMGRLSLDPSSTDRETIYDGRHEFHDTKHRQVTCSIVASARYSEYFPGAVPNPQVSSKVTIDIPCSARPLPPKGLYVVPTFEWQQGRAGQGATTRERRVGIRVYLDRPWFSSGDGERLSVRMAMAPVIVQPPNGGGDPPPPGPRPFDQPNI